jgi:hypothetical protein
MRAISHLRPARLSDWVAVFLPFLCLVWFVCMCCAAAIVVAATSDAPITVQNGSGTIIGYIEGGRVKDKNRTPVGYVRNGHTYNMQNTIIATPEVPGLLLCNCK